MSVRGATVSGKRYFMPETPAGSVLADLKAKTEQGAWDKLIHRALHMPYKTKKDLIDRGYKVKEYVETTE